MKQWGWIGLAAVVLAAMAMPAMADDAYSRAVAVTVTAEPDAAGSWTSGIEPYVNVDRCSAVLNVSASGSQVTVQMSIDGGSTWQDYDVKTVAGFWLLYSPVPGVQFRAGVKQADWSAAAAVTIKR